MTLSPQSDVPEIQATMCGDYNEVLASFEVVDVFARILSLPVFEPSEAARYRDIFGRIAGRILSTEYISPQEESDILELLANPVFIQIADKWINKIKWHTRKQGMSPEDVQKWELLFSDGSGKFSVKGLVDFFKQKLNTIRLRQHIVVTATNRLLGDALPTEKTLQAEKSDKTKVLLKKEGYRLSLVERDGQRFLCEAEKGVVTPIDIGETWPAFIIPDRDDTHLIFSLQWEIWMRIVSLKTGNRSKPYKSIDPCPVIYKGKLYVTVVDFDNKNNLLSLSEGAEVFREDIQMVIHTTRITSLNIGGVPTNVCPLSKNGSGKMFLDINGSGNILDINQSIAQGKPVLLLPENVYLEDLRIEGNYVFARKKGGSETMISLLTRKECIPEEVFSAANEKQKLLRVFLPISLLKHTHAVEVRQLNVTIGFVLRATGEYMPLEKDNGFAMLKDDRLILFVQWWWTANKNQHNLRIVSLESGKTLQEGLPWCFNSEDSIMVWGKSETILFFQVWKNAIAVHPIAGVLGAYSRTARVGSEKEVLMGHKRTWWLRKKEDAGESINDIVAKKLAEISDPVE